VLSITIYNIKICDILNRFYSIAGNKTSKRGPLIINTALVDKLTNRERLIEK